MTRFLADNAIPFIKDAFTSLGSVKLLPASQIDSQALEEVDGLLIRTTTKITPALLENRHIKFIGSATIGTDHVDLDYLKAQNIQFASAPGCNANAVGEFVLNALIRFSAKNNYQLEDRKIGIIGAGNTGSALRSKAEAFGIRCLLNDPFLAESTDTFPHVELEDLFDQADIISLHVPLTRSGCHPTYHMIDESIISRARQDMVLINTSRGGVIDESALLRAGKKFRGLILDVWENEPEISNEILKITDIATPHIAGYSVEGKINATETLYREACRFFGQQPQWRASDLDILQPQSISLQTDSCRIEDVISMVYDIWEDDRAVRLSKTRTNAGSAFAALRNEYNFRREFDSICLEYEKAPPNDTITKLKQLGLRHNPNM